MAAGNEVGKFIGALFIVLFFASVFFGVIYYVPRFAYRLSRDSPKLNFVMLVSWLISLITLLIYVHNFSWIGLYFMIYIFLLFVLSSIASLYGIVKRYSSKNVGWSYRSNSEFLDSLYFVVGIFPVYLFGLMSLSINSYSGLAADIYYTLLMFGIIGISFATLLQLIDSGSESYKKSKVSNTPA